MQRLCRQVRWARVAGSKAGKTEHLSAQEVKELALEQYVDEDFVLPSIRELQKARSSLLLEEHIAYTKRTGTVHFSAMGSPFLLLGPSHASMDVPRHPGGSMQAGYPHQGPPSEIGYLQKKHARELVCKSCLSKQRPVFPASNTIYPSELGCDQRGPAAGGLGRLQGRVVPSTHLSCAVKQHDPCCRRAGTRAGSTARR